MYIVFSIAGQFCDEAFLETVIKLSNDGREGCLVLKKINGRVM